MASLEQFGMGQTQTAQETKSIQVVTDVPVVKLTQTGIYAEKVDANQIKVTENGNDRIEVLDYNALQNAQDIYSVQSVGSNPYLYKSTESIDITTNNVVFYGHGYGHGLGMSQWGAKKLAESGKTYIEILMFYFKDIQVNP